MEKKNICCVCGGEIECDNWDKIRRIHIKMLNQVDKYGEDSLTENQQVLYNNKVHVECYDNLY